MLHQSLINLIRNLNISGMQYLLQSTETQEDLSLIPELFVLLVRDDERLRSEIARELHKAIHLQPIQQLKLV